MQCVFKMKRDKGLFFVGRVMLQRGRSEGWEDQNLCQKRNDYFLILY